MNWKAFARNMKRKYEMSRYMSLYWSRRLADEIKEREEHAVNKEVIETFIKAVHQLDDKVERLSHRISAIEHQLKTGETLQERLIKDIQKGDE